MTNGAKVALKIGLRVLLAILGFEAAHSMVDFDSAVDASSSTDQGTGGEPHFGSAEGTNGRFQTDYLAPNGDPLVSDAAGNMYDPNTGQHYSPYNPDVTRA